MSKALNLLHLHILQKLADSGPSPLVRFDEEFCNDLFRARPRLIELVKGFDEPVIDITSAGRKMLTGGIGETLAAVNKRRAAAV